MFAFQPFGAARVERLFQDSSRQPAQLLMSVVNWGEVYYYSWQHHRQELARTALTNLSRISIDLVPVDEQQALKAGEIKMLYKIPYVDSLAAALSILRQQPL